VVCGHLRANWPQWLAWSSITISRHGSRLRHRPKIFGLPKSVTQSSTLFRSSDCVYIMSPTSPMVRKHHVPIPRGIGIQSTCALAVKSYYRLAWLTVSCLVYPTGYFPFTCV
jgi:hypothetical protein